MGRRNSGQGDVIAGVVLGGVILGLSSLLLSTKKGSEVKRDISEKIDEYRDTVEDYLGSMNKNIDSLEGKATEWTDKVKDTIGHVKEEIDQFSEKDHRELYIGLLIGAIAGGAFGLGASKLFSGNADDQLINEMLSKVSSGANSLQRVIHDISNSFEDKQSCRTQNSSSSSEPVDDVIDFALSGLQLWRKFNKRSR
ncbi:MAG: YtxH domain-containing protein [Chlamydiota bacterium]